MLQKVVASAKSSLVKFNALIIMGPLDQVTYKKEETHIRVRIYIYIYVCVCMRPSRGVCIYRLGFTVYGCEFTLYCPSVGCGLSADEG